MKALFLYLTILASAANAAHAQGTFVYDQESSNDEAYPIGGPPIQFYSSVGQSFTPSLSSVGFVRLKVDDVTPGNALGATLAVRLRSGAMNGPILGTTTPVALADSFAGSVNFYFTTPVAVSLATTYFFETVVQSGDSWGITTLGDSYPNGSFYGSGFPATGNDLWFREGIVVPEPTSVSFILLGTTLYLIRRKPSK